MYVCLHIFYVCMCVLTYVMDMVYYDVRTILHTRASPRVRAEATWGAKDVVGLMKAWHEASKESSKVAVRRIFGPPPVLVYCVYSRVGTHTWWWIARRGWRHHQVRKAHLIMPISRRDDEKKSCVPTRQDVSVCTDRWCSSSCLVWFWKKRQDFLDVFSVARGK